MIAIPDTDPSEYELWAAIVELSTLDVQWTLVGGQMVRVHAHLVGVEPPSVTADADVVADVRARPDALVAIVQKLRSIGFVGEAGTGRFTKPATPLALKFDVLIPESVGVRTERRVQRTLHTVSAPGATQALQRSERVEVDMAGTVHAVPVPNLLGAVILKACAVDLPITEDERYRHKRDLVFLLSLVDNPLHVREQLVAKDKQRLIAAHRRIDAYDSAWSVLVAPAATRARTALAFLVR